MTVSRFYPFLSIGNNLTSAVSGVGEGYLMRDPDPAGGNFYIPNTAQDLRIAREDRILTDSHRGSERTLDHGFFNIRGGDDSLSPSQGERAGVRGFLEKSHFSNC